MSALAPLLPGRSIRSYPAVLSTEADALAWARAGAHSGSVVVADYQASPRGRGGLPWETTQGFGLGFSVVLRPDLSDARQGWLYSVVAVALSDVIAGDEDVLEWPDQIVADGTRAAAFGVTTDVDPAGVRWAVVNVLIEEAATPRGALLARVVETIEQRLAQKESTVLEDHRRRCRTLGQTVRARLIPMGPAGVQVEGVAVDVLADGALLIETERGSRVAVLPHHLGVLEEPEAQGISL
jgi:BirA family biotin operon repressor/biotin-[acetyl-CoA-carboxylase] ligase